jgi:hypothetical protein
VKKPVLYLGGVLLLCTSALARDATPDVSLGDPVYRTLDRFEARGWLADVPSIRPITRLEAARLVLQVLRRADAGTALSRTELGDLQRHRVEFVGELQALGYRGPTGKGASGGGGPGGMDFDVLSDSVRSLTFSPLVRQELVLLRGDGQARETVSQTVVGGVIRGRYGERIGFRVHHFEAREWSSRGRASRDEVMAGPIDEVRLGGKTADFRETGFQAIWATRWFDLDIGKGTMAWGPGRTGGLFLGVRFVHAVCLLKARPGLLDATGKLRSKHMTVHRLEVALPKTLRLGLQEGVVYGDRGPEFIYLPPASVLLAAQTYLGDRDNTVIGLDVSARPARNLKVYACLFLDDLAKLSFSAFANKPAVQVGLFWVDPFGLRDSDLEVEYVRLEPYVYTHHFHINTFEHVDSLLGYPLGPNADRIHGRIVHAFSPSLRVAITVGREREGENVPKPDGSLVNVGGDPRQGRRPDDAMAKRFMDGIVETRTRLGIDLAFEPLRDLRLGLGYETTRGRNVLRADGTRGSSRTNRLNVTADVNLP